MEFKNCTCHTVNETGEHCANCASRRNLGFCDCKLTNFGRCNTQWTA